MIKLLVHAVFKIASPSNCLAYKNNRKTKTEVGRQTSRRDRQTDRQADTKRQINRQVTTWERGKETETKLYKHTQTASVKQANRYAQVDRQKQPRKQPSMHIKKKAYNDNQTKTQTDRQTDKENTKEAIQNT